MMESPGGSSNLSIAAAATVSAAMPSPSNVADSSKVFCSSLFKATNYEFDPSIAEEEKRFYVKAYPTVDIVRDRKTHCTVCKTHIGTAPVQENGIKMHPILRVTHCNKCHDFYNSGEFSKGEDGSELYCRWCGQGGEVYCCSSCPYVFCKSCIVKNLSRGVVADIEQNENWNCFSCAPKILWPLRAQHWALMNYIEQQKKEIYAMNLNENDLKQYLSRDHSKCCRLAKAKCGNMSDSMESLDSVASKRSHGSTSGSAKKLLIKHAATSPQIPNPAKRAKTNDEVVCTPDLLSMLEPDCQITVSQKPNRPMPSPSATAPKIMSIQQPQATYGSMTSTPKNTAPPPLVLRNTAIKLRPVAPAPVVRRTIIGPRTPAPGGGNSAPVYHTINGYRIDLNSAAQQETFRLPNGKLIQVKRQGPPTPQNSAHTSPSPNSWQQMSSPQQQRIIPQTIASRPVQITQHPYNITVQQQQSQQQQQGGGQQVVRQYSNMIGSTTINAVNHNGTSLQLVNGQLTAAPQHQQQQQQQQPQPQQPMRPVMIRHVFPDTPIGQARTGLQEQVFNAMEICTHLTNKVQTLTNSNAYKQARNYLEVKELYIHLSYLLTYAIGRFKGLQDKCLGDMRTLGFGNDADSLENGQLAADKQASDDEDNEIEIVEPKTDLITLDSDDDEPPHVSPVKKQITPVKAPKVYANSNMADVKVKPFIVQASIAQTPTPVTQHVRTPQPPPPQQQPSKPQQQTEENMDLMSMAQSFLASMLEVDIHEGSYNTPGLDSTGVKKQPRKKMTSKPNPTLLKQKAIMERERLEEMKRNDQKLKMKCAVELKKAEDEFPYAKEMLDAKAKEVESHAKDKLEKEAENKLVIDDGKKLFEVEVILEDELNSSTEDKNTSAKEDETAKESSNESEKETETEKEKEQEASSTDKLKRKSNDETASEEKSKEKEAEMDTEVSPEEAKEKETIESEEKDTEKTKDVAENPKDNFEINNEKEKEISEGETEDISEKVEDKIKENSLDDEKEKSMSEADEESQQSNESLEKEKEISKEIEENEIHKVAKDKEKESSDKATTEKDTEEVENNQTEEGDKSPPIENNQTEKPNGIDDGDNNKDEGMETEDQHNSPPTAEVMEVDNEKESPKKGNISKVIEANKSPNDEELDVDKEIEKVLQKRHDNDKADDDDDDADDDDDDDDDDDVEELDNETKTASLKDSIDTDKEITPVKEIKSPNKTVDRTSSRKDSEQAKDLTSKEQQRLETPAIDDAESSSTTTTTSNNNTSSSSSSSNGKEEVIV